MIRAIFEGVAFSHRTHIDRLLSVAKRPESVRMVGGAVNSPLWVQMFADVLGCPVETISGVTEIGALGCAMAATVAAGIYSGYEEAVAHMIHISPPVLPDMSTHLIYNKKYETYTAIVQALDGVWDRFQV